MRKGLIIIMPKKSIKKILIGIGIAAGIILIAIIALFFITQSWFVGKYGTPAEHGSSYK